MSRAERALAGRWRWIALLCWLVALSGAAVIGWAQHQHDVRHVDQLATEADLRGTAVSTLAGDVRALRAQVQARGGTPVAPDPSKAVRGLPDRTTVPVPIPGPRGAQGPAGAPGSPAPIVSPIPGPSGASGPPGQPGADSTVPGPAGSPGAPGADSTVQGPPGQDGKDGTDGQDGKDGRDGRDGAMPAGWTYTDPAGITYTCAPDTGTDPAAPHYTCTPDSTPTPPPSTPPSSPAVLDRRRA